VSIFFRKPMAPILQLGPCTSDWLSERGSETESESADPFVQGPDTIPVIIPTHAEWGRVWVPLRYVARTKGLRRHHIQHPRSLSLCVLYQQGRCHANAKCNQLHVDPGHIERLEAALLAHGSTCCPFHGAPADPTFFGGRAVPIVLQLGPEPHSPEGREVPVPVARISPTFFWHRVLRSPRDRLFFPMGRLCRLHQSGQCKYGAECKNVHVCRVLRAELRSELFEAADPECPFTGDSATDPSPWVPTPTHRPTPRSPLGPIGPAQLGPPNTAPSASPTPKWMHDTLFRSFPMLFHTLTRDDFSPLSPGSTTPDVGPSSPWTPHSGGSSPESEALSWNRWPTPPPH